MADSKMERVKEARKLRGKINFVSWKREFERAARTNKILEYLTSEEAVPPKPKKEEYFGNALRWQIKYNEHKKAKEDIKLASKLLHAWVSDSIAIEIEDCTNAKEAYDLIQTRYAVSNERARDNLLTRLNGVRLDDYPSVTAYTNQVRQIKADLKTVKYDMTDDMFATAILYSLPSNFSDFKEKYNWIRSTRPNNPPDLDYLYERLLVEEMRLAQRAGERKDRERTTREAGNHKNTTNSGAKDPSKIPRALKERFSANSGSKRGEAVGASTETNLTTFRDAYPSADDLDA
ncbi:hypothetical protein G6514_002749 [Epicoccum nigrum]|nr:hypothetical protein G6514_002749 [Epicoccum nigrum]